MNPAFNPAAPLLLQRGHLTINSRPGSACDFHRVTQPFLHHSAAGIAPKRPVLVFNRLPTFAVDALEGMRKAGVAIVCDMDDHFKLDPDHPLAAYYKQTRVGDQIARCVQIADLVIASTARLADELRPFNDNIEVVPNALPFDEGIWNRSTDTTSKTPFVYAGGATHRKDLELIKGAYQSGELTIVGRDEHPEWTGIEADHPDAKFEPLIGLQDWRNFVKPGGDWKIAGNHRLPHVTRGDVRDAPAANYMSAYDGHACAIAPLRDTPFNACKSNLKVLEAGAKGIPIVVSDVEPYANDLDEGFVIYEDCAWGPRLVRANVPYLAEHGAALAEHVRRHYQLADANRARKHLIEAL